MNPMEIFAPAFMRNALLAGCLAGAVLGYLGIFVLLRRVVFLGAALPQFSALGVAAGLWLGFSPTAGALAGALGGILLLSQVSPRGRIPPDGAIGIAFAFASAGALLLLARSAEGESHVLALLSGEILGIASGDLSLLAASAAGVAILHYFAWKEFLLVSYDSEMAEASNLAVRFWDGLLFLGLGVCVALTLRTCGAIVAFSFLVGPAGAALLVSRRLGVIVPLAAFLGACAAAAGLAVSYVCDFPSGPAIAACALFPILPGLLIAAARRSC